MMAWMDETAFNETLESGFATYYSRSRGRLWRKGEESGHRQRVRAIRIDCDADTILLHVNKPVRLATKAMRAVSFANTGKVN